MTDKIFLDGKVTLKGGDCLEVLKSIPDCSIDSCVTDPPYHLTSIVKRFGSANAAPAKFGTDGAYARASKGFMSKTWDGGDLAFRVELWSEVWRVLKPGGWLAAFSATRTYHRMACAIEDSGFEIRDDILNMVATDSVASKFIESLNNAQAEAFFKLMEESQFGGMAAWTYGSGFPKSHDVSKAIDKKLGAERHKIKTPMGPTGNKYKKGLGDDRPWMQEAAEKGYHEHDSKDPATEAAREWQGWGTALKPSWEPICLARKPLIGTVAENVLEHGTGALNIDGCRVGTEERHNPSAGNKDLDCRTTVTPISSHGETAGRETTGRWPANIVHDGSDEVVGAFPDSKAGVNGAARGTGGIWSGISNAPCGPQYGDSGSAARFFYTAKADKLDRIGSKHPTVKPVDLMQWLVRLVTPKGGLPLDPFAGSGSTGEAAWREGMRCVLIEREEEYQADIAERMKLANAGPATRKARAIKQVANDNLPLFGGVDMGGQRGEGRKIYGHFADQNGRRHNGG